MSVAANQVTPQKGASGLLAGLVAVSTRLYAGTIAFIASGYVDDDTDTGSNTFAGIVKQESDNSSGSAGDKNVELFTEGTFYLPGSGFTQADVGAVIYASDNYTITKTSTNNTKIGRCVEFVSATQLGVKIDVQQS